MTEEATQEQEKQEQEQEKEKETESNDFGQILAEFEQKDGGEETRKVPAVGEKVKGTILSIGRMRIPVAPAFLS